MSLRCQLIITCASFLLISCGGGSGGSSAENMSSVSPDDSQQPTQMVNEIPLTVEFWANNSRFPNQAYVSLNICQPGTAQCQMVDHLLVDTGSYGLRVFASALSLPLAQSTLNGVPLNECAPFVSGYTWGSVARADISLGLQTAGNVPLQIIDDGPSSQVPTSCAINGSSLGSQARLGANGILGVGSFQEDCPSCVDSARSGRYYACASQSSCTPTSVPLSNQVVNPVARLEANNNGVVIDLPAVVGTGQPSTTGKLILGIDTNSKNSISKETIFALNANGFLTTAFNSSFYTRSYIDSGSNGLFFPYSANDIECPASFGGFYCPQTDLNLSAMINSGESTAAISFQVGNIQNKTRGYAAFPDLAGSSVASFAWGMPFFYGRRVFTSISGKSAQGTISPWVAF